MASPLIACNIQAICAVQKPRYNELVSRLRAAMYERRELPEGYIYLLDSAKITLPEVSEWITMERWCCPFLTFQLEVAGEVTRLAMRGPTGSKAVIDEAFPELIDEAFPELIDEAFPEHG
jgi:hypothetical protein